MDMCILYCKIYIVFQSVGVHEDLRFSAWRITPFRFFLISKMHPARARYTNGSGSRYVWPRYGWVHFDQKYNLIF
jgi:hypothetical protein